jgi:hypothetical protein
MLGFGNAYTSPMNATSSNTGAMDDLQVNYQCFQAFTVVFSAIFHACNVRLYDKKAC